MRVNITVKGNQTIWSRRRSEKSKYTFSLAISSSRASARRLRELLLAAAGGVEGNDNLLLLLFLVADDELFVFFLDVGEGGDK